MNDMKYEVIDNFLDKKYFNDLVTLFMGRAMLWSFEPNVANLREDIDIPKDDKLYYMTHTIYDDNLQRSDYYNIIVPFLQKLKVICLLRVKVNFYPNTEILYEHPNHTDGNFVNSGAILSLNSCDGYTKLRDGTKIDSVANRILLFDAHEEHCSTTTTNVTARFNINVNYIQEQIL